MGSTAGSTITSVLRALLLALGLAPLASQAMPAHPRTQEELFLAARAAVRAGDDDKLVRYDAQLQGYLLEPYVASWILRSRLEDASPEEVRAFLARERGTVLAERVRKEWLKVLGKQGRWDLFRSEHPLLVHDDSDIVCYALQARWEQKDESALDEVRPQWDAPRELPDGCVPLAEALIARGVFTDRQIWERVRLLLRARLVTAAWRTAEYLPRSEQPDRGKLFEAAAGPKRYLNERNKDLSRRQVRELVMFALYRLARSDPLAAEHYWRKQPRAKFPAEERGYVWGQLALQAAWHNLPQALAWYGYAEADGARLSEKQLDWRMRAALRQGDWREVLVSAQMMSPLQRNEPAWIYWKGRAEKALGNAGRARSLFARIAGGHYFYAELAREELGLPFTIPPSNFTPTADDVAAIAREPGFRRSLALYRLGDRSDATREWVWSIRGMGDRQLLAAAEFALQNEIFDRAINTADKTLALHDFSVRYLAPYLEELGENARAQQLDVAWVLGLVRQESRFISAIRSSAGAAGLMQLMPATARWVARRMGMQDYSWARVTDTDVNAALGTYYLRHVMDELDDSPVLAVAAYNAGPKRADKWRGTRPLEGAIYAETIPFSETRGYVKKVMNNTMYYAAMLGGPVRSLKDRLGIVAPRGSTDGVVAQGEP
jgi:soluble lytic murein transglycosylase